MNTQHTGQARRRGHRPILLAALATMLVIASCGGDDDSSADDAASATSPDPSEPGAGADDTQPADSTAPEDTSGASAPADTEGTQPATEGDPIVIGMSLPMTGPVADRAVPGFEGYEYWRDEINASGGLLGRPVELMVLDDQFDQQTAVSDYNRLIAEEKVDLVLGTFSSDLNLAVAPVAERFEYVYVEPSGGADAIFERGFTYLFFAQPATTEKLPNTFVELIASLDESERPATVAFVQADDPNTTQAQAIFESELADLGVETVFNETYAPETTNFDTIANGIRQAEPDLLISGAVGPDGTALIISLQKVGFSPSMLYQLNSPTDPAFPDAVGAGNEEGIFTPIAYSTEAPYPGNAEFVDGFTAAYDHAPSEDAANSYTAAQVLAAGVEAIGELDQPAIAEWLHANTVDTIVGPLSWDETGRPDGELLLGQYQGGELKIVGPTGAATAEPILLKPGWQG